jgi:hypothetical protein
MRGPFSLPTVAASYGRIVEAEEKQMRKLTGAMLAAATAMTLAACGGGDSNTPTAEENRELNNAAAMLDENTTTDASADSLTVEEAPVGNGDAGAAATGDALVGGGDNVVTNGAAENAQ